MWATNEFQLAPSRGISAGACRNLSRHHRYDQDDSGIERSAQRGAVPFRPRQRCGQPGENRHIPDRIDRRPEGRKILADLQRRHANRAEGFSDIEHVAIGNRAGRRQRS